MEDVSQSHISYTAKTNNHTENGEDARIKNEIRPKMAKKRKKAKQSSDIQLMNQEDIEEENVICKLCNRE